MIPAIYTEDPATEPQWEKIHIRGLDDMHTNDILGFVNGSLPGADAHVQWVDDTSANIVFKTKELAREAILSLVQEPTSSEAINAAPFEFRTAKALASRPSSILTIRVAQAGDRKRKNAREASRYYLMHPEEDPTERMRREFANGRRRRDNGEYERRRFDDREHRRRKHGDAGDAMNDFSANMYDDAPQPERNGRGRDEDLFPDRSRKRSASPGTRNGDEINISDSDQEGRLVRRRKGYRDRTERPPPYSRRDPAPFPRNNEGKELFGGSARPEGGLHSDRMEAPTRPAAPDNREANVAVARKMRDHLMSAQTSPRAGHRRSRAMDAKNEEDLIERFGRKSVSMDSTKSSMDLFPSNGINIKGTANGSGGLSIKGRADQVKELFPERYSNNAGRELFDEPVRARPARRRAGDLFD